MNDVNVTIAGSVCDVQSTNNTLITCVTNAQQQSQQTKVRVSIGNQGIAKMVRDGSRSLCVTSISHLCSYHMCVCVFFQDNADFFYIDVWSSRFTWGGLSPPDTGTFAVITQGQTILLDTSTPVLKMLLILGKTILCGFFCNLFYVQKFYVCSDTFSAFLPLAAFTCMIILFFSSFTDLEHFQCLVCNLLCVCTQEGL